MELHSCVPSIHLQLQHLMSAHISGLMTAMRLTCKCICAPAGSAWPRFTRALNRATYADMKGTRGMLMVSTPLQNAVRAARVRESSRRLAACAASVASLLASSSTPRPVTLKLITTVAGQTHTQQQASAAGQRVSLSSKGCWVSGLYKQNQSAVKCRWGKCAHTLTHSPMLWC